MGNILEMMKSPEIRNAVMERFIVLCKLVGRAWLSKALLHNLYQGEIAEHDVITYISTVFELRRFV